VFPTFAEILDYRPAYDVIAVHCHLSFPEEDTQGGRTCDKLARKLLGWPRAGAIGSPPSRHYLRTGDLDARAQKGLNPINARLMRRFAEVADEMQPYRQRQVFEVHPELSFFQLDDDQPMQHWRRRGIDARPRPCYRARHDQLVHRAKASSSSTAPAAPVIRRVSTRRRPALPSSPVRRVMEPVLTKRCTPGRACRCSLRRTAAPATPARGHTFLVRTDEERQPGLGLASRPSRRAVISA
jgi:hypothetical protein